VRPSDLRNERLITSAADTPYGQALRRAYGPRPETLRLHMQVRSSTTACWQARAGGGIAVVDRAAVAGNTLQGLAVRPFRTREHLVVSLVHNRYRPLPTLQKAFCGAFDAVWKAAIEGA
jgi:DNA-binding transcriptional LysR family regulator